MSWTDRIFWAGLVLIVGIGLAVFLNPARQENSPEKTAEKDALAAAGFTVAEEAHQREMMQAIDRASALADEVARLKGRVGRVQVREVVKWQTQEVPIPLPGEACPICENCGLPVAMPDIALSLSGTEARVETRKGNWVALGEVTVTRTKPPPEQIVGTYPWEATLSNYMKAPEPTEPRWMAGPVIGLSTFGVRGGVALTGPPLKLGRFQARPMGLVLAGSGDAAVAGGVMIGW